MILLSWSLEVVLFLELDELPLLRPLHKWIRRKRFILTSLSTLVRVVEARVKFAHLYLGNGQLFFIYELIPFLVSLGLARKNHVGFFKGSVDEGGRVGHVARLIERLL